MNHEKYSKIRKILLSKKKFNDLNELIICLNYFAEYGLETKITIDNLNEGVGSQYGKDPKLQYKVVISGYLYTFTDKQLFIRESATSNNSLIEALRDIINYTSHGIFMTDSVEPKE
jgi:hypothetical protein